VSGRGDPDKTDARQRFGVASSVAARPRPDPLPVSVVIPGYNAERFIGATLATVHAQTVRPAEIIFVDDGSTDRTAEIARELGAVVLHTNRTGPAGARNAGINAASTQWIALLDADDLWEPDKLEAQWLAIEACPEADIVFTDFSQGVPGEIIVPSFLSTRQNYQKVRRSERTPGVVSCDRESLIQCFLEGNFILPSTALVRRSLALEVGLFDVDILMGCEDRDFFLRALRIAEVAVVERCLMHRRLYDGNLSNDDLRMDLSAAMIGDHVFAHPERYPAGAVERYRMEQPAVLRRAGVRLLEQGRLREARSALVRSLRGSFSLRTLAAYLCAASGSSSLYLWGQRLWGMTRQNG
jgi:glycosyltransferase involved in cell wall biosynthesis